MIFIAHIKKCNYGKILQMSTWLKAGSQSDARPRVALICETHKFITIRVGGFLTIRRKNATQGNTRIESESILASYCVSTSVDAKTVQCNALFSIVL